MATPPSVAGSDAWLLAHLSSPLTVFQWVLGANGPSCEGFTLTPVSPDGTHLKGGGQELFLHSGALHGSLLRIQSYPIHGHSAMSVIARGHEWFFRREDCSARGVRYPPVESSPAARSASGRAKALQDAIDRRSFWRLASGQSVLIENRGGRAKLGYVLENAEYELRFYYDRALVWTRGPRNPAAERENDRRHGLYRLTLGDGYFDVGGERFCLQEGSSPRVCPARASDSESAPIVGAANPDEIVDAASLFWRHQGPFFVPLLASRDVVCQEIDLRRPERSYAPPTFRISTEGAQLTLNVGRLDEGFSVFLGTAPHGLVAGAQPTMVVHGLDEKSFFVNGSRWFRARSDCEAERARVKPANFGLSAKAVEGTKKLLSLNNRYFALLDEGKPAQRPDAGGCARVTLQPLTEPMGRLRVERGTEVREHDYDLYPVAGAVWLGPPRGHGITNIDRMSGSLLFVERTRDGLRVGDTVWYEREPDCIARAKAPASRAQPSENQKRPPPAREHDASSAPISSPHRSGGPDVR